MKPQTWAILALVLLIPTATAEPDPSRGRDGFAQRGTGMHVVHQVDWEIPSADAYDAEAHFYAPQPITNLSVSIVRAAATVPIPANSVLKLPPVGTFDLYRVNLSAVQPNATAGTRYSLLVEYDLRTTVVQMRNYYALPTLTVFVQPLSGYAATSNTFESFLPTGTGAGHAVRTDAAANLTYDVAFEKIPTAAATRDLTRWVWLGVGLVLGLFLMLVSVRRGWVSAAPPARRFEKGGAMEARTMLEARRRTLLAALKELEQAHEAKEIPDDAYAPLKEEYKAQAVRVMRNLEEKREG
jgi:hypothetical protein